MNMQYLKLTLRTSAVLIAALFANAALADESAETTAPVAAAKSGSYTDNYLPSKERFSFSGFGTLGGAYLNRNNVEYKPSNNNIDAGIENSFTTEFNSILGLQGSFKISDTWSATTQVTLKRDLQSFSPNLEWAFIKYQPTQNLSFKLGKQAAPVYGLSDTRLVNYSHVWVTPPNILYSLPFTNMDALSAEYVADIGEGTLTVKPTYAWKVRVESKNELETKAAGLNFKYSQGNFNWVSKDPSARLTNGLKFLGSVFGNPAFAKAANDFEAKNEHVLINTLGADYDYQNWLMSGEISHSNSSTSGLSDSLAWYTTLGYRAGKFTPFVSYARKNNLDSPEDRLPAGLPGPAGQLVSAIVNETSNNDESALSAGLRWDFHDNLALKFQVDHVKREGSYKQRPYGPIRSTDGSPAPSSATLLTTTLDFVF
jgi:hypothetical protein